MNVHARCEKRAADTEQAQVDARTQEQDWARVLLQAKKDKEDSDRQIAIAANKGGEDAFMAERLRMEAEAKAELEAVKQQFLLQQKKEAEDKRKREEEAEAQAKALKEAQRLAKEEHKAEMEKWKAEQAAMASQANSAAQAELNALKEEVEVHRQERKAERLAAKRKQQEEEQGEERERMAQRMAVIELRQEEVEQHVEYIGDLQDQVAIRERELRFHEILAGEAQAAHDHERRLIASSLHRLGLRYGRLLHDHNTLRKQVNDADDGDDETNGRP